MDDITQKLGENAVRMNVDNIVQGYGGCPVIENISFSAESGELVSIVGPNGCGKSTLIKTLCGVMKPVSGNVTLDNRDIMKYDRKELAKTVSYVPQNFVYAGFSSVYDTVIMGRRPYMEWSYSNEDINMAVKAIVTMKLEDHVGRYVNELSGGQMQRVIIARSLAQDPEFYIFDEPTSAFDLRNQLDTMRIMRDIIKKKNACLVVALHDLNLALNYSDKVLVIKDGKKYDFGPKNEVITEKMIKDVYNVSAEIVNRPRGSFVHSFDDGEGLMDL